MGYGAKLKPGAQLSIKDAQLIEGGREVGLYQPGTAGEEGLGLSVKFMGISRKAIASYLISLYCSAAILTDDAVAVLDGVQLGKYHDYKHAYRK